MDSLILLGMKQLEPDPWKTVSKKYGVGQVVTGKVTNITDFGIFVELEEGMEGLIHVSEISKKKVQDPAESAKVGQIRRLRNGNALKRFKIEIDFGMQY